MRSLLRRGSLSLSTNAIVTIVLAFVMLGLGLSIIRILGNNTTDAIPKALSLADLEQKPTADSPLTIDTLKLQANSQVSMKVGFYNANQNTATLAQLEIAQCLDPASTTPNTPITQGLPVLTTLQTDVPPSQAAAFNVIASLKTSTTTQQTSQITGGKSYICELDVITSSTSFPASTVTGHNVAYSKQITLQVAS